VQLAHQIADVCSFVERVSGVRVDGRVCDHTQAVSAHDTSKLAIASKRTWLYQGIDRYLRLIDAIGESL
jgi:hypothetical protein